MNPLEIATDIGHCESCFYWERHGSPATRDVSGICRYEAPFESTDGLHGWCSHYRNKGQVAISPPQES